MAEKEVETRTDATAPPAGSAGEAGRSLDALTVLEGCSAFADFVFLALFAGFLDASGGFGRPAIIASMAGVFLATALLAAPHAGHLADSRPRALLLLACQAASLLIMVLAAAAFALGSFPLLWIALVFLAAKRAVQGPASRSVLVDTLPSWELAPSNGELFLAWGVGASAGVIFAALAAWLLGFAAATVLGAAASVGALSAAFRLFRGSVAAPAGPFAWNPLKPLLGGFAALSDSRSLRWSAFGTFSYWLLTTLFLLNLIPYGMAELHLERKGLTSLLVAAFLGAGLGGSLAGSFSVKRIELGLVPLGALGTALFSALLFWAARVPIVAFETTIACLALLGLSGGIFLLPIQALAEREAQPEKRGITLAGVNFLGALGGAAAFAVYTLCRDVFRFAPDQLYLLSGAATAAGTIYILTILPDHLLRFLFWLGTNLVYKLRVVGGENVPLHGPALLVANHVSFVDGLIILASTPRFIRFVVHKDIADIPAFRRLSRIMRVIPISSDAGPRMVVAALKEAGKALEAGQLVCIFAEGQISRTGQILPFRGGVERILKHFPAPIIPTHLDQVWGSIFSFSRGKVFWKRPRRLPYSVTVSFGKPIPPETPIDEVRNAVQDLESEAFSLRKEGERPLPWTFIRNARRHPFRPAVVDSMGRRAGLGKLAAGVVSLARILREVWKDEEMAGILLPPSVAGAAVNVAASLLGKPTVNLNYTASAESIRSALEQCRIRNVVTSRAFLEKVNLEVPANKVFLEDLKGKRGRLAKLIDALAAWLLPAPLLRRYIGGLPMGVDDTVTVIFSSGSTGEPKGVMQSHFNILSNIQSVSQVVDVGPHQKILGILPFFHSTGYTGGLWSPLITGMSAVYHPNPLDAKVVGELAKRHGVTIIFATPTFIQNYARRCEPGDFGSARYVVVGAEKLTAAVADAFRSHFGIQPLEGYGCTEASPMISVNIPDFRGPGMFQAGWKPGTVGRPLPGVSVRITDVETGERLPPGKEGMLHVKGGNIMKGYLGKPELTAEVLKDGWYRTGDIAFVDDDGFIIITDRLSRFAKIAGEMVPLIKVEEALHQTLGLSEQAFSLLSVPDEKKGERLVVVHTLPEEKIDELLEKLPRWDLPNLWVPRRDAFVRVPEIPRLATGKVDLKRVRELALDAFQTAGG